MRPRAVVLAVVVVLVLALIIGAAVWWTAYKNSPRYALAQALLAANEGDWAGFQRWVDTDEVSEDLASAVVDKRIDESGIEDLGILGEEAAKLAEPAVAEQVEQRMQQQIERRDKASGVREQLGAIVYSNRPLEAEMNDSQARVVVQAPIEGEARELELGMMRADEQWRITRLLNAEELVAEVEADAK